MARKRKKQISDRTLRMLIFERMACPLCHRPHGTVVEGKSRVFVRHRSGDITVDCDVGRLCYACAVPWLDADEWPSEFDLESVGGVALTPAKPLVRSATRRRRQPAYAPYRRAAMSVARVH